MVQHKGKQLGQWRPSLECRQTANVATASTVACDGVQGEDPDYMWIITVIMFWVKLAVGILGGIVSILWLAQVVAYIFTYPPLDPFLNTVFTKLDSVFPLFGTLAFAIFCFYLIRELPALISECSCQDCLPQGSCLVVTSHAHN